MNLGFATGCGIAAAIGVLGRASLLAQNRSTVEQERREFAGWLSAASLSPRRAVGLFPVGTGLSLGPATAAIPLEGVPATQLSERDGRLVLESGGKSQPVARGRGFSLGAWHLLVSGSAGRSTLTAFAPKIRAGKEPRWFAYDPGAVFRVTLAPVPAPNTLRLLAPDGTEVEGSEAGSVSFVFGGKTQALRVFRLPGASEEESELEIYFRDPTNSVSTYPAGRFVSLIPQPGGGYLLDLNRARNPFCAYNTAYPCPAPWRGNTLSVPAAVGERYQGGGLNPPRPG